MTNINIISFFTGKILKKFPLLKETFVVVYFVDYPGFLIDYALIAISFALTTKSYAAEGLRIVRTGIGN